MNNYLIVISSDSDTRFFSTTLSDELAEQAKSVNGAVVLYSRDDRQSEKAVDFVNYVENHWAPLTLPITIPESTIINIYIGE